MPDTHSYKFLIGGRLEAGESCALEVLNPSTEESVAAFHAASLGQADRAVAEAVAAFSSWRVAERHSYMLACAEVVDAHAEELARLLTLEKGSPLFLTRAELSITSAFFRGVCSRTLEDQFVRSELGDPVRVLRQPLGVVVAITPWNGPLALGAMKLAPALYAGNTVILKPSPHAPLSTLRLGELLADVLPPGVLGVLAGTDDLGAYLVNHPTPRMISFTGSTAIGKSVLSGAVPTLKRVTLELGGNDAAIVLDDADVGSTAAQLAMACLINSGQACALPKRVFVPNVMLPDFSEAFKAAVEALKVGDGLDETIFVGPLTTAAQRDHVERLVESAVAGGGRVLCGGRRIGTTGYFYQPAIVTGLDDSADLVAQEQFGPAIPLLGYDTQDEAVQRANGTELGLGGSIWTKDIERAMHIAEQLECGNVGINQHGCLSPDLPFGGWKQSGLGLESGQEGFDAFTSLKLIAARSG